MRNQSCTLKRRLSYLSFGILLNHVCFAYSIQPVDSWFGEGIHERPFNCALVGPLESVTLWFDRPIKLTDNPQAYIKDGQDIIVKADSIKIRNHTFKSKSGGHIKILFSGEILPKGKAYTFCLDSASVCLIDDINVMNSPVSYTLKVPNDMGKAHILYENGSKIKSTSSFSCAWGYMAHLVGNPEWELYREGELIGKYPVRIGVDWNETTASLMFDETQYFDEGVRYRLRLPAGSVEAYHGIGNREETLDFIGDFPPPQKPVPFYLFNRVSDEYDKKKRILRRKYPYRKKVKLVPGKTVTCIFNNGKKEKKWKVIPSLSQEGEFWVLTATIPGVKEKDIEYLKIDMPFTIVEWDTDN